MSEGLDAGANAWQSDQHALVQGAGRYLDDLTPPGTLSCQFARSSLAHAIVTSLDLRAARGAPEVRAVWTATDLGLPEIPGNLRHGPPAPDMGRPPLASHRLRYVGEPLAVVLADSARQAVDAAELIVPELEPLPTVIDPKDAATDEVLLFEDAGTNVVSRVTAGSVGDVSFDAVISVEVENQRVAPLALEPLGILAVPDSTGGLRVWCGHQAPHRLRAQLAQFIGLDADKIRVTVPDVGGGFGARGMLYPEFLVVAAAALKVGRPVKWLSTRRDDFAGGIHGRGQVHRVELSGDRDGTIRRARIVILADMGAYPHNASMIPGFTQFMATGPYQIPEVMVETTLVVTNAAPVGTYRGAGRPEAAYAIERAIDAFARELELDPVAVRLQNLIRPEGLPMTTPTGAEYDSGDYPRALEMAVDRADFETFRHEQAMAREAGSPLLGVGIGFYIERAGGPLTEGEYASVEIDDSGDMTVRVGAVDTGQGQAAVWRLLSGSPFDLSPDSIRVISGDTSEVPDGVGTFASRSTQVCGSVVHRCATALYEMARERAAELLEASPDDLVVRAGRFEVVDRSDHSIALVDVARHASESGVDLKVEQNWIPGAHTFPYGAHIAFVEVDIETGEVQLLRSIAVDDCGRVVDPAGARGQIHGSLAQGLGQARYEAIRYDDSGQLLSSSLMDYLAPRATDVPIPELIHLSTPAPSNPLGAKGIGESGCIGFPAAMVNAVLDALSPLGVGHIDMPVDPHNVWHEIQKKEREHWESPT